MDMVNSKRKEDLCLEKIMQQYFDKFYHFFNIPFTRTDDKELQLQGCDVKINGAKKENIVDEKCATDYFKKDLRTFSFELSFLRRNKNGEIERTNGWFLNDNLATQYYNLGYVRAESKEDMLQEKIYSFECIFVSKKKLQKHILKQIGYRTLQDLQNDFIDLYKSGKLSYNEKSNTYFAWKNGIKIVLSMSKAEKPISVLISKNKLSDMSKKHTKFSFVK